jgi:hypothetical protein
MASGCIKVSSSSPIRTYDSGGMTPWGGVVVILKMNQLTPETFS